MKHVVTRWSEFTWPAWVPVDLRVRIESCWKPDDRYAAIGGKTEVDGWLMNQRNNGAPELGTRIAARRVFDRTMVFGRYVHGQNNLGYVVTDAGVAEFVCSDGAKPYTPIVEDWMP